MYSRTTWLFLACLALLWTGMATAQDIPEGPAAVDEADEEEEMLFGDLDPDDVEVFAEVYPRIRQLEREFTERLRELEHGDHDSARELQAEVAEERQAILDEHGMDSQTYSQIQGAMAQNEELREHIEGMVDMERDS